MATRVAINGFGRIGREVLRIMVDRVPSLEVVAVNDIADPRASAHLFQYDSLYGRFAGEVTDDSDGRMIVNGHPIMVLSERDPSGLPWRQHGVDVVIEATGRLTGPGGAAAHLEAGARRVLITAPARGADVTVNMGINHTAYDPAKHRIVSNGSCTTNCLSVIAAVLSRTFGVRCGLMNTVHSYTNDQVVLDVVHRDLRRARAAAHNIIPTTTGAARTIFAVLPELQGKLNGLALRVPTPTVSVVDLTVALERPATADEVNHAYRRASEEELKGYLGYSDRPLVSSDFKGDTHSAVLDALSTMAVGDMVKVLAWYDNEWGYSCRVADLAAYMAERGV